MIISTDLEWFQTVYLVTDPEQLPRQITQLTITPQAEICFGLNQGITFSEHYRGEISTEPDTAKKLL